ncbi:MAG TPA: aromatic aminobenezylarsenical efflux permease ArsG family transporter [Bacteroidales bacterium]|nr:aromatic aminobenezylarsenical efflux permease ArsG family transporter [Bacteroidales bacterium]HRZ49247.1 aromatic aminobenezylarsenical efflux permease ArsG family transporter [Bacteroidales bacterium]
MEFLQNWLDSTQAPFLTAFILGIMTAISPCPLATNITAIGFISKDLENRRRIFYNGLWYTLGRAITYTALGVVLFLGASTFRVASLFQSNGEKFLGPLLVIIGVLMFDFIKIKFPGFSKFGEKYQSGNRKNNGWSALLLGMVFALAFCPYSGVLYFGMLIPITISSASGLYLPVIFAIATGLPVIIVAYLLAFSISSIGGFYNRIRTFEKWFRRVVAVLFILVGLYYIYIFYIAK